MTLPQALPISLEDIYTEFGVVSPPAHPNLTAFVKGGAYVDALTPGGSIPSAPPISLTNFLGARHIAGLTLSSATATGDFTVSGMSATTNLANINITLSANVVNAHSPGVAAGTLIITGQVNNVGALTAVDMRLPAGQPAASQPPYVLVYGAYTMGATYSTLTPGGLLALPVIVPATGGTPYISEVYNGGALWAQLQLTGPIAAGTPGQVFPLTLTANTFRLLVNVNHSLSGTIVKTFRTKGAGSNYTTLTLPFFLIIYDSEGTNSTFTVNLNITLDSTVGYTAP